MIVNGTWGADVRGYDAGGDVQNWHRRRRAMRGFSQLPEVAGGMMAAGESSSGVPASRSILIGVSTGVLVFIITRVLDRALGLSEKG
jgi:hypothetical protein